MQLLINSLSTKFSMSDSGVQIRLAQDEDQEAINTSYLQQFLRDEPTNIYLKDYNPAGIQVSDHAPNFGLTLIAEVVDSENRKKMVGFLICKICERTAVTEFNTWIHEDNRAGYEISRLLKLVDSRFDVFQMYDVQTAIDMLVLCTVPEYRGRSIGFRLCGRAIDLARERGCEVIFMDCSSAYSAAIARKLGMQCVGEISYEDYQKELGEKLFDVDAVHTHIRRFVKVLNK